MKVDGKIGLFKREIQRIFDKTAIILGEDFSNVNVSLNFVSEEKICELNKQFRNLEKKTDVLSFPNLNKKYNQKLSAFDSERNFDDGLLFLGDIVICKKVAYAQAKEYGHSKKREVCFLALHGLLHLLGYDHIKSDEEKIMNETAEKVLASLGVNR